MIDAERDLLQVAADTSFGSPVTWDQGGTIIYDACGKPPGRYYYRVKACDRACSETAWSNIRWVDVP